MSEPTIEALAGRVARLERRLRRRTWLWVAFVAVILLGWAVDYAGRLHRIETRALILRDEKYRIRASFDLDADDPDMALYDERGATRAHLFLNKGRPGLYLFDKD